MNKKNVVISDPIVESFLNELAQQNNPALYTLPVKDARQVLVQLQSKPVPLLAVDSQDLTISYKSHEAINIRIVRPQKVTGNLPVIVYFHGGGWVLGDENTHDRLIREIAVGSHAAVVFVKYNRAPEKQYPYAQQEGYAAVQWVAKEGGRHGFDTNRIALVGDSVGGHMAATVALMIKEQGGPRILLQVLFYPVTDAGMNTQSYHDFATGYFLEKAGMEWFWDQYVPNKKDRTHYLASPLQATKEQLTGLPPALVMTNEYDVLRDEGEAYAHKLMQAGVPVVGVRYLGVTHDCMMLNPLAQVPAVRAAIAQATNMLRHVFDTK